MTKKRITSLKTTKNDQTEKERTENKEKSLKRKEAQDMLRGVMGF
jgi:hypothetical protein